MKNIVKQGNLILAKIDKNSQVMACLTNQGLGIFKNYHKANSFKANNSQMEGNVIKLSIWEFIFIFGRLIESDSNVDDLFFDVRLIVNEEKN